jgi:hypothetical protein
MALFRARWIIHKEPSRAKPICLQQTDRQTDIHSLKENTFFLLRETHRSQESNFDFVTRTNRGASD